MTWLLVLTRAVHFGSGMVLVAVVVFRWFVLLPGFAESPEETWKSWGSFRRRMDLLLAGMGAVFIGSGLIQFGLVSAGMSGEPPGNLWSSGALSTVLFQTQFGRVSAIRAGVAVGAILLFAILLAGKWQERRTRAPLEIAFGWMVAGAWISLAWAGHAGASGDPFSVRVLADALHLLGAAFWPAGLVPFVLFLHAAQDGRTMENREAIRSVVGRFSNLSLTTVGAMIATGLSNSFHLVGSVGALFTTPYGQILLVKLAFFAVMIALGAWNRCRLLPEWFSQASVANGAPVPDLRVQLRNVVRVEVGLAIGVVIVVAILGITPPAR